MVQSHRTASCSGGNHHTTSVELESRAFNLSGVANKRPGTGSGLHDLL